MNARQPQIERCTTTSAVMLYADGELEPGRVVEVESHLERCASCRAELELARAVRKSLRRSASRRAPEALEQRLRSLVESELPRLPADRWAENNEERRRAAAPARRTTRGVAKLVAFAAAAACGGLMLAKATSGGRAQATTKLDAVVSDKIGEGVKRVEPTALASAASVAMSFDALLDELIELHADPLPPETTNPDELVKLETFVGVPVKSSAMRMLEADAALGKPRFDGARIHAVRERQRAAAIHYSVSGHRMTMYVFDSRGLPMRVSRLERRELAPSSGRVPASPTQGPRRPVYVGTMRGYSVAATEHGGVGYALASDLDPEKNALMVASF
jgi:predicted anti-sigma-YlaC factor YlaD